MTKRLVINGLRDWDQLRDFSCGVPAMDDFIKHGLRPCVEHHYCKVYVVRDIASDKVIAFFALNFASVDLDTDDKSDLLNGFSDTPVPNINPSYKDVFFSKAHYPAIEISYIAVLKEFRGNGIGSGIIELIADFARRQNVAGCIFLVVEALHIKGYNAVPFYSKCYFSPLEQPNPNKETTRMFRTLFP